MKAFKVDKDTVAALLSHEELDKAGKGSMQALAKSAFSSLGEEVSEHLEITAYSNSTGLLIFAVRKKRARFDVTKWYPQVM